MTLPATKLKMDVLSPVQLLAHREQFPALGHNYYFNFGGQGPLPQPALDEMVRAYQYLQRVGPFSSQANGWVSDQVENTRQAMAAELLVPPETLSLTESVSGGGNIALWGCNWQPGDRLLLSDCEHPTVMAIGRQLGHRFGVQVDICPILAPLREGTLVATLAAQVQPQTRVVAFSHVLWNTGEVLPVQQIAAACRVANPNLLIVVDAAQSVGMLPPSLGSLEVDAYAFTGHKWWCGPDGLGGLYIPPASLDQFEPTYLGWRSGPTDAQGRPTRWYPDGRRFEVATSAFPLGVGLQRALKLHGALLSPQDRYERIKMLAQQLWDRLQSIPGVNCLLPCAPDSGLVSFQLEGVDHFQFVHQLEDQGFLLRLIKFPNCIRACVHYLTLESEIEALYQQIQANLC
ncbi:aminotransferase class V-fold PLP-dependent enzyme [Lyngbya confervoides]|uniref:Aminotransferase class V-fold PLP-dependent enzyme n=1 Tax=Lyngbya confervoides BDU141951 TaxID=1574623 RepID=A0ABD4SZX0_9CYAN|nr:aminotransferase class V-fold PLP-dependent enzyme [Lyngbya confervoides]MCM1981961.1 aminotransferase class V-fold PLP-dependent enzyme [Lyngbya confervoides BDU141951]